MRIVILLGLPGSGKGTYSKKLEKDLGFKHLSTGDILRERVRNGEEDSVRIKKIIDEGLFVNDSYMVEVVESWLSPSRDYVLDGFPRNLSQAKSLDNILDKFHGSIYRVFNLVVNKDEVYKRLRSRGRRDDNSDIIWKRLDVFYTETQSLLEFYKPILNSVNANRSIATVYKDIRAFL